MYFLFFLFYELFIKTGFNEEDRMSSWRIIISEPEFKCAWWSPGAAGCWIGEDKRGPLGACGLPLLQEQSLEILMIQKKGFPSRLLGSQSWSGIKFKIISNSFFLQLYILKFSNIKKS